MINNLFVLNIYLIFNYFFKYFTFINLISLNNFCFILLCLIFPVFLNGFLSLSFGWLLGRKGVLVWTVFSLCLTKLILLYIYGLFVYIHFIDLKPLNLVFLSLYNFFEVELINFSLTIQLDTLSLNMLLLIINVSFIIHIFSFEYLCKEPFLTTFLAYISLFSFFMMLLVVSDNFLQFFFAWEAIGLCSYFLISFWHTQISSNKSALQAIFFNRFGDCSLLCVICLIFFCVKSCNFNVIFSILPYYEATVVSLIYKNFFYLDLISICLVFAAMGKSAQIFLHIWLSSSMCAPTPVSALIHSSTLVTSGIFLLIKSSYILEYSTSIYKFITLIGSLTVLYSGVISLFQTDIKKIIAFSTCSQLAYMFLSCGFSNYLASFFHLLSHGFYKSLLFLIAGLIIHCLLEEQDVRKMAGLFFTKPILYLYFLIGSCSLIGFPYLSGFYSKEALLEFLLLNGQISHKFCYIVLLISISLTCIYTFRLLTFSFLFKPQSFVKNYRFFSKAKDSTKLTLHVLTGLVLWSVVFGYCFSEFFIGITSNWFLFNFKILPNLEANLNVFEILFVEIYQNLKVIPSFLVYLSGFLLVDFFFFNKLERKFFIDLFLYNKLFYYAYLFYSNLWFILQIYYLFYIVFFYFIKNLVIFDKYVLELFGPYGLFFFFKSVFKSNLNKFLFSENLENILYFFIFVQIYLFFIY